MDRRKFIKLGGLAALSGVAAPYILPSGRLFASTGNRVANHVVFCLWAGGVRNIETWQKAEGNLMPFTLYGNESITQDIRDGIDPMPAPTQKPLQASGTFFKEFRFAKSPTAHVPALLTSITGEYYMAGITGKKRPPRPTIFEYYRKHNSESNSAMNAWWAANRADPYRLYNYSQHAQYGAEYGGNFIQPRTVLSRKGYYGLGHSKELSDPESLAYKNLRGMFDKHFASQFKMGDAGVMNSEEDRIKLEGFIDQSLKAALEGEFDDPFGVGQHIMNEDMLNMYFAEHIIKNFQPELLYVNLIDIDRGHTDFTLMCNNMRKADFALWHLWNMIQSTPGMKDDTILIAFPEHGRNLEPNTLLDAYGRLAIDHTSDETSREIFCLVLGPEGKVNQDLVIDKVAGESIDVVPTIAHILGFHDKIPTDLPGRILEEAFV